MKRLWTIILPLLLCSWMPAIGQALQTEVLAPITEVKLHLDGAEVVSRTSLVLQPGRNHFLLPDLSSKIYPQTIQVACSEEIVKIVSVTCKTNFLRKSKEDRRILSIRDSVELVKVKIDALMDEKGAYEEEREMLRQNRAFKGDDKTLTVAELKGTADFFRSRMEEIHKGISRVTNNLADHHRKLFDLKLQLTELNAGLQPTGEIHLVLESSRTVRTDLELRYVVRDAGWAAIYDLESGDFNEPITLKYRALAFNNTGIDWNNVKLSLSTADPLQTATQPQLAVWNLSDYSSDQISAISNLAVNNTDTYFKNSIQTRSIQDWQQLNSDEQGRANEFKRILGDDWNAEVDYDTDLYRRYQAERVNAPVANRTILDVPEFNAEFPIAEPYTIPSDKKPYSIDIRTDSLEVTYKYYAVPKLDKDAFLLAQILGWEELNLVGGPVNIYQGRKYVGQSKLDIRNLGDTLSVSFGRDKDVTVTRLKVKGKTNSQLLGGTNKSSVAYNISVSNHHATPISIEIQDQVPISSDKEVIVTIDEMGGGILEEKIGVLTWGMSLQPGESKTVEFGFSIKYPKYKAVRIEYQKSRQMEQINYF
ncbi:MAG TPA: DUF4139 domain-containing protein [Bacteroidia bacterium]|nr:DUF4139 domain-containing protein [Bacteroidia bacterium]